MANGCSSTVVARALVVEGEAVAVTADGDDAAVVRRSTRRPPAPRSAGHGSGP